MKKWEVFCPDDFSSNYLFLYIRNYISHTTYKLTSINVRVIINLHETTLLDNLYHHLASIRWWTTATWNFLQKIESEHDRSTTTTNTKHPNSFPSALPPILPSWLQTNNPYIPNIPTDVYAVFNINDNIQPGHHCHQVQITPFHHMPTYASK